MVCYVNKYRIGLTDQMQQEWLHACSDLLIQNIFSKRTSHIWCLQQNLTSSTSNTTQKWKEPDMSDIIEGAIAKQLIPTFYIAHVWKGPWERERDVLWFLLGVNCSEVNVFYINTDLGGAIFLG